MTNEEIENKLAKNQKFDIILSMLQEEFSKSVSSKIDRECIYYALYLQLQNHYQFEHPTELWDIDADFNRLKEILSNFDFKTVLHTVKTSNEIIPRDYLVGYKVSIKSKNLIWRIHKYDSDPFPSTPHAHLIDSNIKMDLSNGNCFKKKEFIKTIKRKDLLKIREKAKIYFELPPLELN